MNTRNIFSVIVTNKQLQRYKVSYAYWFNDKLALRVLVLTGEERIYKLVAPLQISI